jgi:hypothetical protein
VFNVNMLRLVSSDPLPSQPQDDYELEPIEVDGEEMYLVEEILEERGKVDMPAPSSTDQYFVRFKELFREFTELPEAKVNMMACKSIIHLSHLVLTLIGNLSVLLNGWLSTRSRARIQARDLALTRCYNANKWSMALVECNGTKPTTLVRGGAGDERDHAMEGFMKRVEWLLWRLAVTAAAIE